MRPTRKRILQAFLRQLTRWPGFRKARPPVRPQPPSDSSDLAAVWGDLSLRFFPGSPHLSEYRVQWSRRPQKRTLGSCNSRERKISVARELNCELGKPWLEPLLYHEMCHAVLEGNVSRRGRRRQWHGPEFKALVRRHPETAALDAWMKAGGWGKLVRSDRARRASQHRWRAS